MALLLAPYNDSMRLGMGFNSYTQTICIDQAVEVGKHGVTTVKSDNTSQVVSYSSRFVEKLSDVVSSMNISYGSSIKKGTVEISGNTSSVNEDKIKASDLNAIVSVKVVNQTTTLVDDCKFKPIKDIGPGSQRFNEVYGDSYISGFIEGGEFNGIVSMRVLDRSKIDKVSSSIKRSLGSGTKKDFTLDSMDFALDSAASESLKETETTISVSWMGGGQVKETDKLWDMDSIYASAAAFPARVAQCPQRTWAILTKYKANRSFVEWSQAKAFTPLEYDNISSFTGELFENFMEYKQLLKLVGDILQNRDLFVPRIDKENAITTDVPTLIAVRGALRNEMNKIVGAVDVLAKHPEILRRQGSKPWAPTNPTVKGILLEARDDQSGNSALDFGETDQVSVDAASGHDTDCPKFDFSLLIAPELWTDHMPVPKEDATINPSDGLGTTSLLGSGFPPPPSVDVKLSPGLQLQKEPQKEPDAPKLTIYAASLGGRDVLPYMGASITDQTLTLDVTDTAKVGKIPNFWPPRNKSLAVLYQYSDSKNLGLLLAADGSGVYKITPKSLTEGNKGFYKIEQYPPPANPNKGILLWAITWGDTMVTSNSAKMAIWNKVQARQKIKVGNETFGSDPLEGVVKTCAIFYQLEWDKPIQAIYGREDEELLVAG